MACKRQGRRCALRSTRCVGCSERGIPWHSFSKKLQNKIDMLRGVVENLLEQIYSYMLSRVRAACARRSSSLPLAPPHPIGRYQPSSGHPPQTSASVPSFRSARVTAHCRFTPEWLLPLLIFVVIPSRSRVRACALPWPLLLLEMMFFATTPL